VGHARVHHEPRRREGRLAGEEEVEEEAWLSIKISVFGGEIPRTAPHLLDEKHAQQAQNVKIQSGALKAYKLPLTFSPVKAAVTSLFRMVQGASEFWLLWSEDVNAVPGPIANDSANRVYYTGQATPRKTNYVLATNSGATTECPFDYLELGVPRRPPLRRWP
jgi:hypothetical protein